MKFYKCYFLLPILYFSKYQSKLETNTISLKFIQKLCSFRVRRFSYYIIIPCLQISTWNDRWILKLILFTGIENFPLYNLSTCIFARNNCRNYWMLYTWQCITFGKRKTSFLVRLFHNRVFSMYVVFNPFYCYILYSENYFMFVQA